MARDIPRSGMTVSELERRIRNVPADEWRHMPPEIMRYTHEEVAWIERQTPWHPRMTAVPKSLVSNLLRSLTQMSEAAQWTFNVNRST